MKVTWQNIDKALGDLIVHEGGLMFQRLAISLAKLRWPEIIATTPHNDGGEDAFMPYYFESNGKHLSVACSITATYDKIKSDAQKIIDRGKSLDILVFYTPERKSNRKLCDDWGKKLKQELGCDLLPIPREEIIHTLLEQDDHWRCREFLSLNVPHTPDIQMIVNNVKSASREIIDQWKENLLSDTFLVELTINEKTKYHTQEINHEEIASKLSNKHRFVLYGSPGSGKTTTLIQVAQKLVDQELVPFLLSLPEWIDSTNDNIIDYLVNNPCLSSKSITTDNLLSLYKNGKCVFLLNGWNEVEPSNIKKATRLLARLNREYTAAGIILATRESSFSPPFFDESKLTIKELSNSQRRQLIQRLISEDISGQIENNCSLSQITRTPLFLIELIKIYQDNRTLPRTRVEIFEQVVRRIENSSKHSANLQSPPISGKSEYYLTWLASYAIRLGQVIIKYDNACSEIKAANTQLQQDGQLQTVPESTETINILCDHHILVKSSYPENTIRFVHQQFQEYYAHLYAKRRLWAIAESDDEKGIYQFQEEIINYPVWEEPLKLLAEEIADKIETSSDGQTLKFGEHLVRWTIPIDPIFAAELVNILGVAIWNTVKNNFEPILRNWYDCPDKNHKACALTAMFATGTDAFSDIIWPLLEHKDNQVRLTTYRTAKTFSVSSLGNNWKNRIDNWTKDRRSEFLSELSLNGGANVVEIFEDYAQNDPSTKVKVAAINAVGWYAPRNKLYEVISTCDDETFKTVIQHDYILNKFPDDIIPKATKFYSQALKELDDPRERLRLMLRMHELCGSKIIKLLKKELRCYRLGKSDYSFINNILKIIVSEDPKWVNLWVCQQIANGNLYYDHYSDYITKVPESLIGKLLKDFVKPDYSKQLEFETKKLIAAGANLNHVHFIIQEIARLSSQFMESSSPISDIDRNFYHRLVDVSRLVPLQNLVTVILQNYQNPEAEDLKIVLGLLGTYRIEVGDETSLYLQEKTQKDLRDLLCRYSNFIPKTDDFSGVLKADLSCAMALFGQPEDIAVIKELVAKDIERVRNGRKARKEGIRNSPQVNGCGTSWAGWHIRAILKAHSDKIEGFLIQLLNEPEYENEAANGLVQLLWKDIPTENMSFTTHVPLTIGSHSWREEYIDSAKRKKYAQAIVQRINDKRKKDSCCAPKTLAGHLARLNDPDTIPLILEILAAPGKFDAWNRVHTLEMLIRNGHCFDTATVENIINPAIEQATNIQMSGKQDMYLLSQCLCILVCSTDTRMAIRIINRILAKYTLWYELRGLIETLGNRKNSDAANYLIHLCQQKQLYNALCYELIKALGKTEVFEAKQALLSTIDNSISSPKIPIPSHNGRSSLNQALANICKSDASIQERIISLCNEQNLSKEQKIIILSTIHSNPSNKAIIAAVSMISQDNNKCSIPRELTNAVERSVIQYVPVDNMPSGHYNLRPQINSELSVLLFESVVNKRADWLCAFKLLGYINWLRIKHGRPQLESRHPDVKTQKPWPLLNV